MDIHKEELVSQQSLRDRTIAQLRDYKVSLQRVADEHVSYFCNVHCSLLHFHTCTKGLLIS